MTGARRRSATSTSSKASKSSGAELGLPMPVDYRPLLVGVFWPSQRWSGSNRKRGPGFAAGDPAAQDAAAEVSRRLLADIANVLPTESRSRFFELAQADTLNKAEARELAAVLVSIVQLGRRSGRTVRRRRTTCSWRQPRSRSPSPTTTLWVPWARNQRVPFRRRRLASATCCQRWTRGNSSSPSPSGR